ncbi:hypothetical protein IAT40_001384 [Kwoniella sp. CBS 6097]
MPSPPPPLTLHHNDIHSERRSSEFDALNAITPLAPRDREPARPISIGGLTSPTGAHSYSLGSQESTISDLSESLRASPPPLTTTSALPTPYSIRTPATTEASSSATTIQQPIIASPLSPSIPHEPISPSEGGLVRVKSFPHNGDLLGNRAEASSSRSIHRADISSMSPGSELGQAGTVMEVGEEQVAEAYYQAEPNQGDRHEPSLASQVHPSPSGPGSLTRLLQDIGSRPSSAAPVYPQSDRSGPGTTGNSLDWRHAGPSRTTASPEFHPGYNALGWVAPAAHLAAAAARDSSSSGSAHGQPSRIVPTRSSSASRTSMSTDFRTLPSPISNVPSSGSPGALERRIDNIEARLERARSRGHRSPPTPPPLFAGHAYEGIRIRPNAVRPYDPPSSRNRHFGTSSDDASVRYATAHSSARQPWSNDSSSSSSATVPPPRVNPLMSFGWDPAPYAAPPTHDAASRLLVQSLIEAESEGRVSPVPRSDSPAGDVTARPWYLQQRMNMLDSLRSGAIPPTATHPISDWSNFEVHSRPDFPLRRVGSDTSDDSVSFRHAFGMGIRERPVQPPPGSFSMGWDFEDRSSAEVPIPVRPANRRWMSFDEGERENSRERERERGATAAEGDSNGSLNRDIHEAIGRRLSQVRPRSSSITRRLRDQLGPDWEDARVDDTSSGSGIDDNRPAQRQRTEGGGSGRSLDRQRSLWGEVPRQQTDSGPRFEGRLGGREWLDAYVASSRDRSTTGSPADELAAFIERRTRNRTGHADLGGTGHRFGLDDGEAIFLDRLRSHEPFFTQSYRPDFAESMVDLSETTPALAYLNTLRRMQAASGPPLSSVKFTPEMTDDEKSKIVQMVIRGMARLPAAPRKKAAEDVLEILPWGQFGEREGMDRDEYCSVCHDEYEDEVKIAVTPCKHMYHKDCLDTWLDTPNHSSCPMCRRDLAALACLTKMTPTKTVDEALPLWMNAAL